MKSKSYKYGIAALVGVSALALAGCQSNENQSSTSKTNAKSKSSIVKIEKKSKSKSSKSEKQEGEVKKQSSEKVNKASSSKKDVEKVPTATELMNNVSAFNEGNFDIRLNYATVKGYDTGIIQENPRVLHYKFNGGMNSEVWATDQFVYSLSGDKWTKIGQTYKIGRFDPMISLPSPLINQMKVSKTSDGYQAKYEGNSAEAKELMEHYIVWVSSENKWNPFGDQDFTSATLTYSFNKQKQLTEIHYDWTAGSNKGTASYTNINQQKIAVPNDVIQAAAKNSDSIDNNNDDNSDDE